MYRLRFTCALLVGCLFFSDPVTTSAQSATYKVLVFSKTAGFRHDCIPNGIAAIQALGATNNFSVDATEDDTLFTDANLAQYKAVIFLCTTGDILTDTEQAVFQRYIEAGGGWVGIHSAADTEYAWPWYGGLLGAYFSSHPAIQQATIKVADRVNPSTSMLPKRWVRTDEWYSFQTNPRGTVQVLATLDETTYTGGTNGFDHPLIWCHTYDGGRAWYTAIGHTQQSYTEPLFLAHLLGGIQFAAGVKPADVGGMIDSNYQKVILDNAPSDPMELAVAADGRVFYAERAGNVKVFKPNTSSIVIAGHIDVETLIEDGLLGITLDPGFSTNNWLYLFYSPTGTNSEQHISRFTVVGDTLDLNSEKILLRIATQRLECCHSSGSLFMHTNGDLYISAGDNSNPFSSDGYAPVDEQSGRSAWDAQKSAANENDLRGKILRIHPQPDGTYTIPSGNLFPPGTPQTRPEIYIMGCRNPFRMAVDEGTGWLYWGEVGPDANADAPSRGPKGYDEWNQARSAGNYGWPYFVADNKPYVDYDFATSNSFAPFDPNAPVNDSPNNTGPTNLPPARPAWIWYPYDNSTNFPELNALGLGASGGRTAMGGPTYYYKTNGTSPHKLSAYFDSTLFIWEWSRNFIKEVKLDDDGSVLKINPFLPTFMFNRPMDLKIGPDGLLYLIEWGTGFGGGNPNAKISRIEYVGGIHAPVAVAAAVPDSGSAPLTVQFSSAGTYAPDPGDSYSLAWSFFGDGTTNSTAPNPTFTYTNAGNYSAQLIVNDIQGNQAVANVAISVGNNKPVVTILSPPNGAIFDWGKALAYQLSVFDKEDGSTTNGTIPCANVIAAPSLGHNDHSHPQGQFAGCSGVFTAPINTDADSDNLFLVLNATYMDQGAPGVAPVLGKATYIFQPRHKQAEFFSSSSGGLTNAPTGDPAGGGLDRANIAHGSYITFNPVNLTNINAITYRVASSLGGRIEAHLDSAAGPLISTANVPFTGGAYTNLTVPVADPGGTHALYLVFLRNPGDINLFVVNWLEFQGPGLSLSPTPFGGQARAIPGIIQAEDFDNGGEGVAYHDTDAANNGGQYRTNEAVDIQATIDTGGGYDVAWAYAGEWLDYSVNVGVAGIYTLGTRVSSQGGGGAFHLEINGANKTGPQFVPNTGNSQSWVTLSITNVLLDPGPQTLRLVMDTNGASGSVGNFNFMQATLTLSNTPPTISLTAPADQAVLSAGGDIIVSANAADVDGSVTRVDFFGSGFSIGTDTNAPYSITWSNVPAGNYLVTARATDNIGNTTSATPRTIRVINGATPFTGFPKTVPGTIQFEDFDNGGEGVAYHDYDPSNNGGQYRNTGVDIETANDTGGGFDVGWTGAGEWLKYTINAAVDGLYTLQIRTASSGNAGAFHIEFDGVNRTGPLTNSDSGGWQTWRNLTKTGISLTAGPHVMALVEDSSGTNGSTGNFNYITLSATATNQPPVLVHRYSFSEPAGSNTATDSVGQANGTVIGGAAFNGSGQLSLLGTNGYVNLPNGLISSLTSLTIEAWVTWNGGGVWQRLFDFGSNSNGENNQGTGLTYLMLTPLSVNSTGVWRFAITTNSAGSESALTGSAALPIGQQVHVAVTYDFVAGLAAVYLNGQQVATGPATIPLSAINDVNVWLGRSNWPDPYFNGVFDEFRIYSGVLSDTQVAASFVAGPNMTSGTHPLLEVVLSGNTVQLSWPTNASGFNLESATNLQPVAIWNPVTNVPVPLNGAATVTLPITNASRFFRLRQ
ncbi:MAG: domain containing protein [Pedosphaera sp.]|nr:domain containing protein [Pedosphaera sp.]